MKVIRVMVSLTVVLLALCMPSLVMAAANPGAHSSSGCVGCHTPHNAQSLSGVPLWNGHETTMSFTPYSSATFNATAGQPDGASKLCLSCHDGSNTYTTAITDPNMIFGPSSLTTTHPISFVYNSQLATVDKGLKDPSVASTLGGTIAHDLLDPDGKVQCSSCHDVHSSGVGTYLLRGYDYFSGTNGAALCQMCHLQ